MASYSQQALEPAAQADVVVVLATLLKKNCLACRILMLVNSNLIVFESYASMSATGLSLQAGRNTCFEKPLHSPFTGCAQRVALQP